MRVQLQYKAGQFSLRCSFCSPLTSGRAYISFHIFYISFHIFYDTVFALLSLVGEHIYKFSDPSLNISKNITKFIHAVCYFKIWQLNPIKVFCQYIFSSACCSTLHPTRRYRFPSVHLQLTLRHPSQTAFFSSFRVPVHCHAPG